MLVFHGAGMKGQNGESPSGAEHLRRTEEEV